MSCFPFFIDIKDKHCVIVGGGKVALRKVEKLLPFGPKITVIAPSVRPEIFREGVAVIQREFRKEDITDDTFFAIGASSDAASRALCAQVCREKHILYNLVTDVTDDMFVFPSLLQCGPMTLGVTTTGASPTAAQWVRDRAADALPDRFEEILDQMALLRPEVRTKITDSKLRESVLKRLFTEAIAAGRPLTEEELKGLIP